jgi:hypothetical protein
VASVRLYQDVDNNGLLNTLNDRQIGTTLTGVLDDGDLVFSSLSEVVNAGGSENWLVVYNYQGTASDGETFQVGVAGNGAVVDVGVTSGLPVTNSGAPLSSGVATISQTGSLSLTEGANNPTAQTISGSEQEYIMLQLRLTAGITEAVEITSVIFNTGGSADEVTDIDSVRLIYDINNNGQYDPAFDQQIGLRQTIANDNGLISFAGISETVGAGSTANWLVVYYFNGSASNTETFRVYLNTAAQITVQGDVSANAIIAAGLPVNGNFMSVSSVGTLGINLSANNAGNQNVSGNAGNLVMMSLDLSDNNVEDLIITGIRITPTGSGLVRDEITDPELRIYNDINKNGSYDSATDPFIASANYGGATWAVPAVVTIPIDSFVVAAQTTASWIIVNTFNGGDVNDYLELAILENSDISGIGSVTRAAMNVTGASLNAGRKTVVSGTTPGTLTLSPGADNPDFRYISRGAQNEVMLQLHLTASPIENIQISSISFSSSGSGDESTDVSSVRLFNDVDNDGLLNTLVDVQIGTTINSLGDNGSIQFNSINHTISSGTSENWIVVYNYVLAENALLEAFQVTLPGNDAVVSTGVTSAQTIIPSGAPVAGGQAVISESGTLTLSAGAANPGNINIAGNETNLSVIQVALSAGPNENISVSSIRFRVSGSFDDATDFTASTLRLYLDDNANGTLDAGDTQLGANQSWSGNDGTVTFSSLSQTILLNTTQYWIVLCNLSGQASSGENFRVSLQLNSALSASGVTTGNPVVPTGAPVSGGLFSISSTGSLVLALGSNNPAASYESAAATNLTMLQLALSASSVEAVAVNSITFTADGSANDLTDMTGVSLYRDLDNNGQLGGSDTQIDIQRTYTANNGTVTFTTTGETIDAGSTENWLVVYNLNNQASVNETFRVGIYNAANISCVGVTSTLTITASGTPKVGSYKTISSTGSITLAVGSNNPASAYLDNTAIGNIEMMQFRLTTSSVEAININSVTITHQGTGTPASQILSAVLVRDVNADGTYDGGDVQLTSGSFSGSTATLSLSGISVSAGSSEYWLVVYNFASGIASGTSFRTSLQVATAVNASGATSLNTIIPAGTYPVSGGTQTLTAYSDLTIVSNDLDASPQPGDSNVGLMQLNLSVNQNVSTIFSIQVDNRALSGTTAETDVDLVKIYREDGTSTGFQFNEDQLLGSSSVTGSSGGSGTVTLGSGLAISGAEILYIAFDISVSADPANSMGVLINSSGYLNVKSPETNLNPANFPINSGQDYSLPVELISFNAAANPGVIAVEWITASEINNHGFILQRRTHQGVNPFEDISSYEKNEDLVGQISSANEKIYLFEDNMVQKDSTYEYQLIQVDLNGSRHYSSKTVLATALEKLPTVYALKQNYPNPFNPQTTIGFDLPVDALVTIEIYDILGQKIINLVDNEKYKAGRWEVQWNGKNNQYNRVASGLYFYRISANEYSKIMKMIMVK